MIAEGELPRRSCIPLAPSPSEGRFWFQLSVVDAEGERKFWFQYLESEAAQTPRFPLFLFVSDELILCFPSVVLSLSPAHMPPLAGGFVCFMP